MKKIIPVSYRSPFPTLSLRRPIVPIGKGTIPAHLREDPLLKTLPYFLSNIAEAVTGM